MNRLAWAFGLLLGCRGGDKDGAPHDTSAPEDSADDSGDDTNADGDDTADSGDSGAVAACPEPTVTFEHEDLSTEDLTGALLAGTYTTLDRPGRLLVCPGTWFARLLVRANVEVVGLGDAPADTVLSGGESGTILDVVGPDVALTVRNLSLDRGAGLDVDHNSGGGGIYCASFGTVTVDGVSFTNNFANDGPGMYTEDCTVLVSNSEFTDNLAEDDGGAATFWYSEVTMDQVTFTNNLALDGGALAVFYGNASLSNMTFRTNSSDIYSGGLWFYGGEFGSLTLTDSTFEGNLNEGDGGGVWIYAKDTQSATLERVSFTGNGAGRGGGLFVYYDSKVTGTDCAFDANSPEDIYAADYSEAGGVSYTGGAGYSFSCEANVCVGG